MALMVDTEGNIIAKIILDDSEFQSKMQQVSKDVEVHTEKIEKSFYDRFVKIAVGFSLVYQGMRLVREGLAALAREAWDTIPAIDEFNKSVMTTTAIMTSMSKDQNPFQTFKNLLPEVNGLMKDLERHAAGSILEFKELQTVFSTSIKQGVIPVTDKDIKNLTTIAEVIKAIPPETGQSYKFEQELRRVYEGTYGNTKGAYVANFLANLGVSKEDLASWKQLGVNISGDNILLDQLATKLSVFKVMHQEMQNSWTAVSSSAKMYWDVIKRIGGEEVSKVLVEDVKKINDSLVTSSGYSELLVDSASLWHDFLAMCYETVRTLVAFLSLMAPAAAAAGVEFKGIAVFMAEVKYLLDLFVLDIKLIADEMRNVWSGKGSIDKSILLWKEFIADSRMARASLDEQLAMIGSNAEKYLNPIVTSRENIKHLREEILKNAEAVRESESSYIKWEDTINDINMTIEGYKAASKGLRNGLLDVASVEEYKKHLEDLKQLDKIPLELSGLWLDASEKERKAARELSFEEKLRTITDETKAYAEILNKLKTGSLKPEDVDNAMTEVSELSKYKDLPKELTERLAAAKKDWKDYKDAITETANELKKVEKLNLDTKALIDSNKALKDIYTQLDKNSLNLNTEDSFKQQIKIIEHRGTLIKQGYDINSKAFENNMNEFKQNLALESGVKELEDFILSGIEGRAKTLQKISDLKINTESLQEQSKYLDLINSRLKNGDILFNTKYPKDYINILIEVEKHREDLLKQKFDPNSKEFIENLKAFKEAQLAAYNLKNTEMLPENLKKASQLQIQFQEDLNLDRLQKIKDEADQELEINQEKIRELNLEDNFRDKLTEQAMEVHNKKLLVINGNYLDGMKEGWKNTVNSMSTEFEIFATLTEDVMKSLTSGLSNLFFDLGKNIKNTADAGRKLLDDLLRTISNALAQMVMSGLIKGGMALFGSLFSPPAAGSLTNFNSTLSIGGLSSFSPSFHSGGFVTSDMIPRYHIGGLASDEVPAILQTGETVLPRGVTPNTYHISFNVQAMDSKSLKDFVDRNQNIFLNPIINDIESGRGIISHRLRSME